MNDSTTDKAADSVRKPLPEPASVSMWEIHSHCFGTPPTYRCAACWAQAYDDDSAKLSANLRAIGYPPKDTP